MNRRLPSPSMIVACIALAVALGGTSYAALSKNSVGSKQIKKAAVKGQELAPNSVTSPKVKDRSLKAADFAKGALPSGPQGPPGPPGAPNPSAETLDGVDSKGFAQVRTVTNLNFTSTLEASVSGFGDLRLICSDIPATTEDEISLLLVKQNGGEGFASGFVGTGAPTVEPFAHISQPSENAFFLPKGPEIAGTYRHTSASGERTIIFEFGGREDPTDSTCAGHMTIRTSG